MHKINERTWAEIEAATREIERKGDGSEGPGPEWLPCGAQAMRYWQDENGEQYAGCGGPCQFKLGRQSHLWHVFKGEWE